MAVGDAWACTNPSLGRGITLGLRHAVCLRDIVRSELGAPARLAEAFDAVTEAELTPWYRATLAVDLDRQAEIEAIIDGRPVPPPADEAVAVGRALMVAMAYDPEAYRAFLDTIGVLKLPQEALSRPGLVERIMAIAESEPPLQIPGPSRQELVQLAA
jgi:flavin-dependent dehydrogenase